MILTRCGASARCLPRPQTSLVPSYVLAMRYFLRPHPSLGHAQQQQPTSTPHPAHDALEVCEMPELNYEEHGYLRSPPTSATPGASSSRHVTSSEPTHTPHGTAGRRTLAHYQSAIRLKANVEKSLKEARATMNFWRKKAREDMDYVMTPSTSKASSVGSEGGAQDHLTPARRAAVEALLERYRAHAAGGSAHSSTDDDSEVRWAAITLDICAHFNSPELQRRAHARLHPLRRRRDPGRARFHLHLGNCSLWRPFRDLRYPVL